MHTLCCPFFFAGSSRQDIKNVYTCLYIYTPFPAGRLYFQKCIYLPAYFFSDFMYTHACIFFPNFAGSILSAGIRQQRLSCSFCFFCVHSSPIRSHFCQQDMHTFLHLFNIFAAHFLHLFFFVDCWNTIRKSILEEKSCKIEKKRYTYFVTVIFRIRCKNPCRQKMKKEIEKDKQRKK